MRNGVFIGRLVFALGLFVSSRAFPQSPATWSGQAQCQLAVQSEGYVHREIQSWTLTGGAPTQQGAMQVYPATWSVTGQGGRQDILGTQTTTAQWNTTVPPTSAPLSVFVNSANQLIIKSYHAQLRVNAAVTGLRQVSVSGIAQAPNRVSFTEFEWQFPSIEVEPARTDVSGTNSMPITSSVGPMQPGGVSGMANCQWQFLKGAQPSRALARSAAADKALLATSMLNNSANSSQSASRSNPSSSVTANQIAMVPFSPPLPNSNAALTTTPGTANTTSTGKGPPSQPSIPGSRAVSLKTTSSVRSNLQAPSGFAATNVGDGSVKLTWQAVSGASKYRIDGTGIPSAGLFVSTPTQNASATNHAVATLLEQPGQTIRGVPLGPGEWKITAVDSRNIPSQPASAQAIVRYVPTHAGQWLSKNNGLGSEASTKAHYLSLCDVCTPGATFGAVAVALGLPSISPVLSGGSLDPGYGCAWGRDGYGAAGGLVCGAEAAYSNITEFGTARTTLCLDLLDPTDNHITKYYLCYAKSGDHGLTVIAWTKQYTWFLTFTDPNPADSVFNYTLTTSVNIDSEGPKHAPNVCLSCHGGTFDGTHVTGSSLLPLDPGLLQVSDTSAENMTNILGVNQRVMGSGPSPAVKRYVMGIYGADPLTLSNGSSANLDYVPQGWKQQSDFYKAAVRPYCMMCHLATPSNLDFSTYGNFVQNKALINAEVCSGHTMPHAEYPFKQFWTKDTGNLFIPGYLVAALGITSCQ